MLQKWPVWHFQEECCETHWFQNISKNTNSKMLDCWHFKNTLLLQKYFQQHYFQNCCYANGISNLVFGSCKINGFSNIRFGDIVKTNDCTTFPTSFVAGTMGLTTCPKTMLLQQGFYNIWKKVKRFTVDLPKDDGAEANGVTSFPTEVAKPIVCWHLPKAMLPKQIVLATIDWWML